MARDCDDRFDRFVGAVVGVPAGASDGEHRIVVADVVSVRRGTFGFWGLVVDGDWRRDFGDCRLAINRGEKMERSRLVAVSHPGSGSWDCCDSLVQSCVVELVISECWNCGGGFGVSLSRV